jgi:RNA polymerase-binding transcription factor DksA
MDSDAARELLEQERVRLSSVREGLDIENPSDETENQTMGELSDIDQHQADVGTETFEREKDYSILERVEAELADVEHALKRLDDGTYGTCEACGKPIGDDRLQAMPAARFCVDDQQLAEREARAGGGG